MTRDELKAWLKADVTLDGILKVNVPDATYDRIIDRELKRLYEIYPDAQQYTYFVIPAAVFYTQEFRKNRVLKFPECVISVTKFEEMRRRNSMYGVCDPDLGFNKVFQADLWLGSLMNMDTVAFRTIQWSTWDQLKQFTLVDIQHRWNAVSHELLVLGHDPHTSVFCGLIVKAPESDLFDNIWVQKWISAHCKLQVNDMLTMFQTTLIGGVTINMSNYVEQAKADIEEAKEKFKQINNIPNMYRL